MHLQGARVQHAEDGVVGSRLGLNVGDLFTVHAVRFLLGKTWTVALLACRPATDRQARDGADRLERETRRENDWRKRDRRDSTEASFSM